MQLPLFETPSDWVATSVSDLPSWEGAARIGLDTETRDPNLKTTGPSIRTGGFMCGASFAIEDGPSHYLPTRHEMGGNLPEEEVLRYLTDQAKNFKGILVGANLNYDLDYLAELGITFPNIKQQRDIQVAAPLINELHNSYSLDNIALRAGFPGKDETLLRQAAKDWGLDHKADLWRLHAKYVGLYADYDAVLPLRLLRRQERAIEDEGLWDIFNLECDLQPVLLKMRRQGVRIDLEKLDQVKKWSIDKEKEQLDEVFRHTGQRIKLGDIHKKEPLIKLFTNLGVELTETTDSGKELKLDDDVLDGIDHPVADCVRRARKVNKLRSTFVSSIHEHRVGDRIHCTFNQLRRTREGGDTKGARYGRMSCVDPNLQQQPSRDDFASMWRSIYVPDHKGQLWMSADYSQQEPRMTTHFADILNLPGANEMAERFRNDPTTDNHDMMTKMVHPEVAHLHRKDPLFLKVRKPTKDIFLGLCYGMGAGKLAHDLGLPTTWKKLRNGRSYMVAGPEGQALFRQFDKAVPYVNKLSALCAKKAKRRGYIVTLLGRHCHFPKKKDGSYDWTHKSMNRLIQGSSGDQTKKALVELDRAGVTPQLQVHDEFCGGINSMKEAYLTKEVMEHCVELRVPSLVDIEVGPSWGEAKEIA